MKKKLSKSVIAITAIAGSTLFAQSVDAYANEIDATDPVEPIEDVESDDQNISESESVSEEIIDSVPAQEDMTPANIMESETPEEIPCESEHYEENIQAIVDSILLEGVVLETTEANTTKTIQENDTKSSELNINVETPETLNSNEELSQKVENTIESAPAPMMLMSMPLLGSGNNVEYISADNDFYYEKNEYNQGGTIKTIANANSENTGISISFKALSLYKKVGDAYEECGYSISEELQSTLNDYLEGRLTVQEIYNLAKALGGELRITDASKLNNYSTEFGSELVTHFTDQGSEGQDTGDLYIDYDRTRIDDNYYVQSSTDSEVYYALEDVNVKGYVDKIKKFELTKEWDDKYSFNAKARVTVDDNSDLDPDFIYIADDDNQVYDCFFYETTEPICLISDPYAYYMSDYYMNTALGTYYSEMSFSYQGNDGEYYKANLTWDVIEEICGDSNLLTRYKIIQYIEKNSGVAPTVNTYGSISLNSSSASNSFSDMNQDDIDEYCDEMGYILDLVDQVSSMTDAEIMEMFEVEDEESVAAIRAEIEFYSESITRVRLYDLKVVKNPGTVVGPKQVEYEYFYATQTKDKVRVGTTDDVLYDIYAYVYDVYSDINKTGNPTKAILQYTDAHYDAETPFDESEWYVTKADGSGMSKNVLEKVKATFAEGGDISVYLKGEICKRQENDPSKDTPSKSDDNSEGTHSSDRNLSPTESAILGVRGDGTSENGWLAIQREVVNNPGIIVNNAYYIEANNEVSVDKDTMNILADNGANYAMIAMDDETLITLPTKLVNLMTDTFGNFTLKIRVDCWNNVIKNKLKELGIPLEQILLVEGSEMSDVIEVVTSNTNEANNFIITSKRPDGSNARKAILYRYDEQSGLLIPISTVSYDKNNLAYFTLPCITGKYIVLTV